MNDEKDERKEDKKKIRSMNPYQRLKFIHEMAIFNKTMWPDDKRMKEFCDEIIKITRKYSK